MEPTGSAVRLAVHSLLSLLAEGGGRHAALSLLHERSLQVTGGRTSILFEPHPTTGHLHPTSANGPEVLALGPWIFESGESAIVAQCFSGTGSLAVRGVPERMPWLHGQLGTDEAVLMPIYVEHRRAGLLAVGVTADPDQAAAALAASEVAGGFALALELTRLRQREAFERDVHLLLDELTLQASSTLDLHAALEPVCVGAARLFGADRLTVWLYDRQSRALEPFASSDGRGLDAARAVRADDPLAPAAVALRSRGAGIASQPAAPTVTLTVPLKGYRRALGTLVFEGVRIEAGEDLALLARADELGRRLSSAIEAAQLITTIIRT